MALVVINDRSTISNDASSSLPFTTFPCHSLPTPANASLPQTSMVLSVAQLLSALSDLPCPDLSFATVDRFIRFTRHLKPELCLGHHDYSLSPMFLPDHVATFLSRALQLDQATVARLWTNLRHYLWDLQPPYISQEERYLFDEHGPKSEKKHHKLDTCGIRYYLNFGVKIESKTRFYYDKTVLEVIHLEEKAFIETALSELFTASTLFAWVSAQNSALIYNHALSSYGQCEVKQSNFLLTSMQVRRAFVLISLLKDWREQGRNMVMRDDGDLDSQLKDLICERNNRMIMEGQPERLHACDSCEKLIPTDIPNSYKGLRSLRAVVTDGTAVGHYCCKVHNCTNPLANNRHHFCPMHMNQRHICAFSDCDLPVRPGYHTCSTLEHSKLQRVGVQPQSSLDAISEEASPADLPDDGVDSTHKSDKGNRPSKVIFSRRTTHNEQLVVCTCGVIAARATMYGAESISGVKDFLKSVYPNPQDLPDVVFYDNNCHLQSHLQAQRDEYFRGTMLPVDVFHFKSKHKESDEFCQKHCNPAQWTELVGDDGEWIFNSSAAEQSNVWIGGYQAILRDMLAHNFDFFLDEMIKRRNMVLVAKLRQEGKAPYRIPPYPSSMY
ncbi:hypothetical protein FB446DRAFT_790719 [Lentinula raphanica]|nr:hypothetical protein FB446DRAFT_790719 [Lentinula raphanica]